MDDAGFIIRKITDEAGYEALIAGLAPYIDAGIHEVELRAFLPGYNPQYETLFVEVVGQDFNAADDYVQLVRGVRESTTVDVLANDTHPGGGGLTHGSSSAIVVDSAGFTILIHKVMNANGFQTTRLIVIMDPDMPAGQYMAVLKATFGDYNPQYENLYVEVAEPIVANDDSYVELAGVDVSLPVLENDTTYDNDPLEIERVTQPNGANVAIAGSVININGPPGDYSFQYTVQDKHGIAASAVVNVTLVAEVVICDFHNNPPGCVQQCPDPTWPWPECLTVCDINGNPQGCLKQCPDPNLNWPACWQ
ncbi:MAG: cadherin-like domain-containing protein [Nitrospinota bacterium]|nr:cadherin-like domain-containing protein [Nitrospinota bacterium]